MNDKRDNSWGFPLLISDRIEFLARMGGRSIILDTDRKISEACRSIIEKEGNNISILYAEFPFNYCLRPTVRGFPLPLYCKIKWCNSNISFRYKVSPQTTVMTLLRKMQVQIARGVPGLPIVVLDKGHNLPLWEIAKLSEFITLEEFSFAIIFKTTVMWMDKLEKFYPEEFVKLRSTFK